MSTTSTPDIPPDCCSPRDRKVHRLPATGPLISPAFRECTWEQHSVAFGDGDLLFLNTDGVSDALAGEDDGGDELVIREIQQLSKGVSPVDAVLARARQQLGGRPQADDLTALSVGMRHEPSGE